MFQMLQFLETLENSPTVDFRSCTYGTKYFRSCTYGTKYFRSCTFLLLVFKKGA